MRNESEKSKKILMDLKELLKAEQDAGLEWLRLPRHILGPSVLEKLGISLRNCTKCKLASSRSQIVFGEGNPRAKLLFIGEAPGAEEDRTGRPFIGKAGELLSRIIQAIDLSRDQVYISSIVKCRPPGNRTPEAEEIAACKPFLIQQIMAIQPVIICTLGSVATQGILNTQEPITKCRGQFHKYQGIYVMPTFHPAYLLRNPKDKKLVWEDMQKIQVLYRKLGFYDKELDKP
ncbi:MAG: uracil-DNA glycosylase [bacterium]